MWVSLACAATALTVSRAQAEALLVIDVESGKVLYGHNAGNPWYPASVTKLMVEGAGSVILAVRALTARKNANSSTASGCVRRTFPVA